jgi:hypothetical protein
VSSEKIGAPHEPIRAMLEGDSSIPTAFV